jgi:hypothetical protein
VTSVRFIVGCLEPFQSPLTFSIHFSLLSPAHLGNRGSLPISRGLTMSLPRSAFMLARPSGLTPPSRAAWRRSLASAAAATTGTAGKPPTAIVMMNMGGPSTVRPARSTPLHLSVGNGNTCSCVTADPSRFPRSTASSLDCFMTTTSSLSLPNVYSRRSSPSVGRRRSSSSTRTLAVARPS